MSSGALLALVILAGMLAGVIARALLRRAPAVPLRRWGSAGGPSRPVDDETRERWRTGQATGDGDIPEIDEHTWLDLDVDAVITTIDRTRSLVGRQTLHAALRRPADAATRAARTRLVGRFLDDATSRDHADRTLTALGREAGTSFWHVTVPGVPAPPWWHVVIPLLALTSVASLAAMFLVPAMAAVFILALLVNAFVRAAVHWSGGTVTGPMRQAGPLIAAARHLRSDAGIAASSDVTELDRAIDGLAPLRRYTGWLGEDPLRRSELRAALLEYLNIVLLLEANAAYFGARHLAGHHRELRTVADWVGEVDLALATADLRAGPGPWTVPALDEHAIATTIRELRHPLVANDVVLVPGRGIILTGANMSGKSTLIRAVGIAALLGRTLDVVPAAAWHGQEFAVQSSIRGADDLRSGRSFYLAEAERITGMLRSGESGGPHLFLVDELFRGTNTVERIAAGEAVLRRLLIDRHGSGANAVLAATHDRELADLLGDRYAPWCLEGEVRSGAIHFDYRLRQGVSRQRTAVALLELTGAPPGVVTDARRRAEGLERHGLRSQVPS